jgi:hypothetical protein
VVGEFLQLAGDAAWEIGSEMGQRQRTDRKVLRQSCRLGRRILALYSRNKSRTNKGLYITEGRKGKGSACRVDPYDSETAMDNTNSAAGHQRTYYCSSHFPVHWWTRYSCYWSSGGLSEAKDDAVAQMA